MKKIYAVFLSIIACICISGTFSYDYAFAEDETSASETVSEEKDEPSKAPLLITVIAVFTVTSAVTAYFTYKSRVKSRK